ncbi:AAHS family 4-hydroxybenzoate transporter-like MFS transporter [Novosphingobium chloroacetimidivorans]|uniref:AAHS family 4-hydroxybenzoate transporter-like MFS transporter n=1 Tax=Novosphingobium chloroacetimidivorans TaxID=1428314 RepID=A0A7W7KCH7_9SPHN|nr:MFS transporter [Novosphingobium chloroacetimidivorans]MBB4860309.1 AAHS family 4-hydroxybenzoate transporter-like MFS transporter [Novosphingobium chloroacetimidivorans]
MNGSQNVSALLDGMRPNRRLVAVWLMCAAVLMLDGYDLTVIALMAPELVKEFGFSAASLGAVFSASLVGMALGAPLGGWIGDRYGRKLPAVVSCCLFGCATLLMLAATTIVQLAACRFVVGIGLGVALTSAIALCAEFAPGQMRSRVMALVGTSVPVGAIIPGVLTATLVPDYGWRVLAIVGGILPILLAIILFWALPESLKYLALRPAFQARLTKLLRWLDPDRSWHDGAAFVPPSSSERGAIRELFQEGLRSITLLIWSLFFVNAVALYLITSWLPLTLRDLGMSASEAGQVAAAFSGVGMIGGLVVAALISRAGVVLLPALFAIAVPSLLSFAVLDLGRPGIILCVLVAGLACGGVQVAMMTVVGTLYPTRIRASGIGWGVAAGRVGAIVGPFFGSLVYSLDLPRQRLFTVAAVPMIIGTFAAIFLLMQCIRRFGGVQVDGIPAATSDMAHGAHGAYRPRPRAGVPATVSRID